MLLFGIWCAQLQYDVKDNRFSSVYFRCAEPLFPETPGYKRLNRWECLVTLEKSLFPFPGFSTLPRSLVMRWTFMERHPGAGAEISESMSFFRMCVTQEGYISTLEKKAGVTNIPWNGREGMLYLHYHAVQKPDVDPVPLVIQHSTHKLPLLENPSGLVNPMFHKPALPPPQPIELTRFYVKGIDSETLNGSLLNQWFLLNSLPPNAFGRSQNSVLLYPFPFSPL